MSEPNNSMFSTQEMSATFSSEAHVQSMLLFEAALARAEARAGLIPQEAAIAIAASCRVNLFDVAALYREAALAGTPVIPLVRMLTALVEGDAHKFVHWGATSQDVIDSALMLQMRDGLDLLIERLLAACAVCATLTERHRHTLMVGRTLLQQALPMTFGLKAARWLALMTRQVQALRERREHTLAVQLGGAAGTLASFGDVGLHVVAGAQQQRDDDGGHARRGIERLAQPGVCDVEEAEIHADVGAGRRNGGSEGGGHRRALGRGGAVRDCEQPRTAVMHGDPDGT
jgi:3-carboxy-cis,cis-muconate cycloisomerase